MQQCQLRSAPHTGRRSLVQKATCTPLRGSPHSLGLGSVNRLAVVAGFKGCCSSGQTLSVLPGVCCGTQQRATCQVRSRRAVLFCAKGSWFFRGRYAILPAAFTAVTKCSCGCNCHSNSCVGVACMLFGHVFAWQKLDNMSCSDTIPYVAWHGDVMTHMSHTHVSSCLLQGPSVETAGGAGADPGCTALPAACVCACARVSLQGCSSCARCWARAPGVGQQQPPCHCCILIRRSSSSGLLLAFGSAGASFCEFCLGFACAYGVSRLGLCMHAVLGWVCGDVCFGRAVSGCSLAVSLCGVEAAAGGV